jgi:hypothetical protein
MLSMSVRSSGRRFSKAMNPPENLTEQRTWHGHFGHLEDDVSRVRNNLRAYLNQLLS